jgi:hypothetical protein
MELLYLSNDHRLSLEGLFAVDFGGATTHPDTSELGDYVNDATVTVTLYKGETGNTVAGETWPLSLSYVSASNGDYEAVLSDGLALREGRIYVAVVTVDATTEGVQAEFRLELIGAERTV